MTLTQRYKAVLSWFAEHMPAVGTELHYTDAYQLLVATMLAAQCTDRRVNMISPALFERFPSPQSLAEADISEIFEYIRSVTYPNNKARHLQGMGRKVTDEFGGRIPDDLDALQTLPGVGRKTANVVGAVLFGKKVMPVDTHVFRVAARIGLSVDAKTPLQTEMQLSKHIPADLLPTAHHWLILHGRYVCLARKPRCEACGLTPWCAYYSG
jgi:endonuclease-3